MLDVWLFSALGKYQIRNRLNAKMHELASEDSSQENLALQHNLACSLIALTV